MSYEVTFADNTEVTLENMNDIAKDLGDTEFSEFSTNKFGVDTLNSITSDLVSSGILRTEENANMGCEPVIGGNNVIIRPGVIVFETGAKLRITEAETIAKTNSTYIYAKNDHITGLASIVVSETAPTNQMDAVQICRIDANGNLIDLRSSSVAKVPLTTDAENMSITRKLQFNVLANSTYSYDLGFNGWKYIIVRTGYSQQTNTWAYTDVLELNDNDSTALFPSRNDVRDNKHPSYYHMFYTTVTRRGSILEFQNDTNRADSCNVEIEVR